MEKAKEAGDDTAAPATDSGDAGEAPGGQTGVQVFILIFFFFLNVFLILDIVKSDLRNHQYYRLYISENDPNHQYDRL